MKVKNFFFDHRNNEDKKNVDNSSSRQITFCVVSIAIESVIIIYDMIWKFFVNSFLKYLKVFFFKEKFLIETNFK